MQKRSHRAYDALKRLLDVAGAATALVIFSPVMLIVSILVRLKLGSPVIFRQRRPGKGGRLFTMYKFRTMRDPAAENPATAEPHDAIAAVATDADRLTPLGRQLRAASLDELPELFNVILGDMSLVGPRPLLPEYLERYNEQQARRHEVRPGVTGWAQVNGRNATTWDERLAMDVWYVDNRSLPLDLRILAMTVGTVLRREGVSAEGQATMEPFDPRASGDGKGSQ